VTVATATGAAAADLIGVDCAGSARALGGGVTTADLTPGAGLLTSAPTEGDSTTDLAENGDTPTGWFGEFDDISGADTITVFAICAP
jgi:hypothetical protein